jgi:poly(3-hydroxybutyrate) depolymerase
MTRRLVLILALTVAAAGHAAKIEKLSLRSKGLERHYYLFVPDGVAQPMPILITLHGSGRDGKSLVEPWSRMAEKEHFIVAGPDSTNPQQWAAPADGPVLLRDVVEDVKKRAPVDTRRIYLFGHSAGAGFALQMALLESEYFAAVAVHAGDLKDLQLLDFAARKVPVSMFVGTRDPGYPLAVVRGVRDAFLKHGFPVELTEIPRHDHNYYAIAQQINEPAWAFLHAHPLAEDAKFAEYANM